jgi:hypothetical protein
VLWERKCASVLLLIAATLPIRALTPDLRTRRELISPRRPAAVEVRTTLPATCLSGDVLQTDATRQQHLWVYQRRRLALANGLTTVTVLFRVVAGPSSPDCCRSSLRTLTDEHGSSSKA